MLFRDLQTSSACLACQNTCQGFWCGSSVGRVHNMQQDCLSTSHSSSLLHCPALPCRLSPAVVSARCALLDHCMQDLLQGPPALAYSPLVAAFLDPARATYLAKGDKAAAGSHAAQPTPSSDGQDRAGQPSCSQQPGWASSAFSWTQSGSAAIESPAAAAGPAAPRSPRRAPGRAGGLPAIREGVEPASAGLRCGDTPGA